MRADAARLADWLDGPGAGAAPASLAHTLGVRRSHLEHRVAVVARDRAELAARLRHVAAGEAAPGVTEGTVVEGAGTGVVWVFSGTGAQWPGMGRELLATEPAFAAVIDRIDPVYAAEIGTTARRMIQEGDVSRVDVAQAMIFAVQAGLTAVWTSLGVRPAAVVGHSLGEIAAAVAAGVLSVEDGARLVCRRSVLLRRVAGAGGMLLVGLSAEEATDRLGTADDVVPAVLASPTSTVLSGPVARIDALAREWSADPELLVRRVDSEVAFHSPQMDPLLDELARAAAPLTVHPPAVPIYGTALADPRDPAPRGGAYWAANLRNPVRLAGAVAAAAEDGFRAFLEISAHPVVGHSVQETLDAAGAAGHCVAGSLRRDAGGRDQLLLNAGLLYCHGAAPDRAAFPDGELLALPPRTWRRRTYWRDLPARREDRGRHDPAGRTLLGPRTVLAGATPLHLWRTRVDMETRPYPGHHTIQGTEIVPAAVVLQTFLDATGTGPGPRGLTGVDFALPLTLEPARDIDVTAQDGVVRLLSRPAATGTDSDTGRGPEGGGSDAGPDGGEREWLTHASASAAEDLTPPDAAPPAGGPGTVLPPDRAHADLAAVGVPTMAFPWEVTRLERLPDGLRAEVTAADGPEGTPDGWAPLLDAALSVAAVAFPGTPALRVVAGVSRVWTAGGAPDRARIEARVTGPVTEAAGTVDVTLVAADGRTVAVLAGVRYAGAAADQPRAAEPEELLYATEWHPLTVDPADLPLPPRPLVLVGPAEGPGPALRARCTETGRRVALLADPDGLDPLLDRAGGPVDVLVLPVAAEPAEPAADRAVREAWLLARTARRLAARPPGQARLWSLTVGVREAAGADSVAQAARWGLGRIIGGEHPDLWGGTLDLAPDHTAADLATALDVSAAGPGEDVVAVRGGRAEANRLVRCAAPPARPPLRCRADGSYLITGGLGGLGGEIARRLVELGARRLVLAGRSALPPRSAWDTVTDPEQARRIATVRRLEALGATVRVVALDIADAGAAAAALDPDALDLPPIRGVVHAAGVTDDRLVEQLDRDALAAVIRPKAAGAFTLHRLFPPGSLDFVVHFSSCGQLLGLTGQGAYAAANAFLDAVAGYERAAGSAGSMSLAWTSWRGIGLADNAAVDAELAAHGVGDVTVPEALAAWDHAARLGLPSLAVLRTVPLPEGTRRTGLLRDVTDPEPATPAPGGAAAGAGIDGLSGEELRAALRERTAALIVGEMRWDPAGLDPDRSLLKMGMDSVMAIVIRRKLEQLLGRKLPANLVWHQQTVSNIVDYLVTTSRP
ncbi:SDR family NAD(P)-dependent oxidoreductase [Streptomyces pactum]|uniref:SDR family NAD(P)-dependent oxidoreductase n=1 Tax=Streptomyces pactum TaxID=68249 RepID=UPI003556190F